MKKQKSSANFYILILTLIIGLFPGLSAHANVYDDMMEENRAIPVVSNEVENWPQGPVISARSAILMDADTGAILYNKDSHVRMYPASTTKLMTSLLVMEHEGSNLNDLVEISATAVDLPWDASTIDLVAGDKLTLEECLYAILVCSANEVSNAVAEYVSGDIDSFVKLMNERAKELGCTDTTFEDAHGYSVNNHMTTAYDLALIAREAFKNELLCKMARTPSYHLEPTEYQQQDIEYGTHNLFIRGNYVCEGLVGSKTGFTDESRQVLATACERNGMRLIAVVMQEETPNQYIDTLALFDYGFANFESLQVSEAEKKYQVTGEDFFHSDSSIFGDSSALFTIDR
nr:D-alanyl-D-alanine carboxypeptidase [Lachnospiraceae bacterium]